MDSDMETLYILKRPLKLFNLNQDLVVKQRTLPQELMLEMKTLQLETTQLLIKQLMLILVPVKLVQF